MALGKTRMEERKRLIQLWESGWTPTELARKFEVSRPTVYELIERWRSEGQAGLEDRSSRPHSCPGQTESVIVAALLNLKDRYPHWGPEKLVRLLRDEQIELSASTARDILQRNGRVQARRARPPRWSPAVSPTIVIPEPGHSMSADHKGQFRLGNGRYCFPLTIADPASRFVFAIEAQTSTSVLPALAVFERVFREWGLPEQMITDNGCPFCTTRAMGGLTELSKTWIKLEIQHVRIVPGRPQQNGIHERMHRTLKQDATQPPEANEKAQQYRFDGFQREFNYVRPHQALGQERPASRVMQYRRPYPNRMPSVEYPSSFEVRKVRENGHIKWQGQELLVSEVLRHEPVGLVRVEDERWRLYFGAVHLASWNERTSKFESPEASSSSLSPGPETGYGS